MLNKIMVASSLVFLIVIATPQETSLPHTLSVRTVGRTQVKPQVLPASSASDFHVFATSLVNATLTCDRADQDGIHFFTTTRDKATLNSPIGLTLIVRAQSACNDAEVATARVTEPVSLAHVTTGTSPNLTLHQIHFLAFSWTYSKTTFWQDAQKVWQGDTSPSIEHDVTKQNQNANDAVIAFALGLAIVANHLHTTLPSIPAQQAAASGRGVNVRDFERSRSTTQTPAAGIARAPANESLYDTVPLATADAIVHLVRPFDGAGRLKASLRVVGQASGTCPSASYATGRSDAYRCFAGSLIQDPCFVDESRQTRQLVCMNSPVGRDVTLLTLQRSLPQPSNVSIGLGQPWALTLATGETCGIEGGATLSVGTLRLNYGCTRGVSVYGNVDKGRTHWTVLVWRGQLSIAPRLNQLQRVKVSTVYF